MTISPDEITPGERLRRTLAAHGVKAVHATDFRGPTVVQHAFALEAGQKIAKVEALSKDLALSLGLEDVRIVAPIPGTAYVGIEVPRTPRETVTYADFIDAEVLTGDDDLTSALSDTALPFPVGVGIGGDAIWADLAKLPHLLIAGATGSGKSVALASLIASLVDHRTPNEVRLWLIDPKRVELGVFVDAPQVEQVATDVAEALEILETVEDIMDTRYQLFERANVRNITEYNEGWDAGDEGRMPYHVVVIDEVADLMMQAKKDIEPKIVRIAQLARAAGIHLVLATQRPTVDVITGLIAANVVSRWTFAVRSVKDSMVALEQTGAQALYGKGDSLWLPAGADKPLRVQAVYADNVTIQDIVERVRFDHCEIDVVPSGSPRAATEDDDFDLADVGVPIEDLGGLIEEPRHRAEESEVELTVLDDVDLETGSNLEDPDAYNLQAELAPLIADLVERAVTERERQAAVAKDARFERLANKIDGAWRKWILVPVVVVACVWALGRIVGA